MILNMRNQQRNILLRIIHEYVGISYDQLSRLEKNVLSLAATGTSVVITLDEFGEINLPAEVAELLLI